MMGLLILAVAATAVYAEVSPDPDGAAGIVRGRVDIDAPPGVVWAVIRDCRLARRMAPSVQSCKVLSADPEGAWDVREMVVQPPLVPAVRSVFRSEYEPMTRITFRCTEGDIKMCQGEWRLTALQSGGTRVSYTNRATSPYPIPAQLTRAAMKGDVSRALKALRRESVAATR
jgi:carbon monoxide dehydrogenase subunit G